VSRDFSQKNTWPLSMLKFFVKKQNVKKRSARKSVVLNKKTTNVKTKVHDKRRKYNNICNISDKKHADFYLAKIWEQRQYLWSRVIWNPMKTRRTPYVLTAFLWLDVLGKFFLFSYDWRTTYNFIWLLWLQMTLSHMLSQYTSHIAVWLGTKDTASAMKRAGIRKLKETPKWIVVCKVLITQMAKHLDNFQRSSSLPPPSGGKEGSWIIEGRAVIRHLSFYP